MARVKIRYNADPDVRDVPLSVEEAAWVAENPRAVKGPDDVSHLAGRAAATARQLRETRAKFDEELRRRTSAIPARGVQSTLGPEAAARFLSPDQLAGLFDGLARDKLAALDRQRASAEAAEQAARRLLGWLAERDDVPADVREQARAALGGAPAVTG